MKKKRIKRRCACGCGQITNSGNRYINGHNWLGQKQTTFHIQKRMEGKKNRKRKIRRLCLCGCEKITTKGNKYIHGHNNYKHHLKKHPLYTTWNTMKQRCHGKSKLKGRYQKKGIRVCIRWRVSLKCFIHDMGKKPSRKHTIERIDNNGNYTPDNCKWATVKEQCANKGK